MGKHPTPVPCGPHRLLEGTSLPVLHLEVARSRGGVGARMLCVCVYVCVRAEQSSPPSGGVGGDRRAIQLRLHSRKGPPIRLLIPSALGLESDQRHTDRTEGKCSPCNSSFFPPRVGWGLGLLAGS